MQPVKSVITVLFSISLIYAGATFPFADFEGSAIATNGTYVADTKTINTYPTLYNFDGTTMGTLSLDKNDFVSGMQSLKMEIPTYMQLGFNSYNYDGLKSGVLSPRGFTREYADNPSGWKFNTYNRLVFWIKSPLNGPTVDSAGGNFYDWQIGTYVKMVTNPDLLSDETGGFHGYHMPGIPPTNTWTKVVLNTHPDHSRGVNGNLEEGNQLHPTGEPDYNYFDCLSRFYIDETESHNTPRTYHIDGFTFVQETNPENDDQVYSICVTYVPSDKKFILTWKHNKNEDVKHEVRYATSDIHQIGWDAATPAPNGIITPPGGKGGYNGMFYHQSIPVTSGTIYFAIKPQNSQLFSQISYPLSVTGLNSLKNTGFVDRPNSLQFSFKTGALKFLLPFDGNTRLVIYTPKGEHVATLIENKLSAGTYSVDLTKKRLHPGCYLATLQVGSVSRSIPVVMMR